MHPEREQPTNHDGIFRACAAWILRDHIGAHRIWAEISLPHRAQEQPGSRLPELEQSLAGEAEGRRKMQRRTEAGRIETAPKERSRPAPDAPEKDEVDLGASANPAIPDT